MTIPYRFHKNIYVPDDEVRSFSHDNMDDLHKRYIDRRFLALKEDWEVKTFEANVKKQRPQATSDGIHRALMSCQGQYASNHPREKIMGCVIEKI